MRRSLGARSAGVVVTLAMLAPIGGLTASPAGAAAGTACKTITADAKFAPGLPVLGRNTKVASTVTATGTVGHCSGGGVKSGTVLSTYRIKSGNCRTLLTYSAAPTSASITITWNTNKTSTAAVQLRAVKGDPTKHTVTGAVTTGPFTGMHITATFTFALLTKKGCLVVPLKEISVSGGPFVIK
jgi:hypothetical protein